MKLLTAVFLMLSTFALAQWNTAKVVSFDMKKFHNIETDNMERNYELVVQQGDMLYYAERTLEVSGQRAPLFTEGADVKFKLDKNNLTVVEESGREFKMKLVKKSKKVSS